MLHTSSENRLLVLASFLFVIFALLVPVAPAQEQSPTPTPAASPTPPFRNQQTNRSTQTTGALASG